MLPRITAIISDIVFLHPVFALKGLVLDQINSSRSRKAQHQPHDHPGLRNQRTDHPLQQIGLEL